MWSGRDPPYHPATLPGHYYNVPYVGPSNVAPQFLQPPPPVSDASVAAPQRRKRASKPKVRTGCTTCKIRRIKCDEKKPHCLKCTSTGRKCDGYEFPSAPKDEAGSSALSPLRKPYATYGQLFLPSSISQTFGGDTRERRIFHRFQVCTIPAFVGGSEAVFWNSIVLKVGHQEPVVRNAIVALGTLHEDYQSRAGRYSPSQIHDRNHQNALQLYGIALRRLNEHIAEGGSKAANTRLAIISSVLFACFEVLRRNNMAAVVHYQAGLRQILRQMNLPDDDASIDDRLPEEELKDMLRVFARYDIQACTFSKAETARVGTQLGLSRTPPPSFSLARVREHLDDLLISVYQLVKSDLRMYRYWKIETVPIEWQLERDRGLQTFEGWMNALEEFFSTAEEKLPLSEVKPLLGLRLQIKVAMIMLKTCIDSGPEKSFDAFYQDFEDIVDRVERLSLSLKLVDGEPLDCEKTSFTMELGIAHPLFFVATKCRDANLRRRAIALLRKTGREGVWEGPVMAVLAERIVEIEEKGIVNGEDIPERNRVHEIVKDVDYDHRRVLVQMTRAKDSTWLNWETIREAVPF